MRKWTRKGRFIFIISQTCLDTESKHKQQTHTSSHPHWDLGSPPSSQARTESPFPTCSYQRWSPIFLCLKLWRPALACSPWKNEGEVRGLGNGQELRWEECCGGVTPGSLVPPYPEPVWSRTVPNPVSTSSGYSGQWPKGQPLMNTGCFPPVSAVKPGCTTWPCLTLLWA